MKKFLSIFTNMNIGKKLVIFFLLLGIVPLIVATLLAYSKSSAALNEAAFNQLIAIRDIKKNQITEYFDRALLEMETFGRSKDVAILWDELVRYHVDTKVRPDGPYDVTTNRYREIWETYGHSLKRFLDDSGFYDIYVICVAHGHVMYTAAKEVDLGTNLRYGPYKESGLAKLREKVIEAKGKAVVDLEPYAPKNDEPAAFAGCPIHNAEGKFVGLMVVQMSLDQINAIMTQRAGLGETGETYLIGQDKLMRSDSYLDPVNHSVMASFANPDKGSVDTEGTDKVIAGISRHKLLRVLIVRLSKQRSG